MSYLKVPEEFINVWDALDLEFMRDRIVFEIQLFIEYQQIDSISSKI